MQDQRDTHPMEKARHTTPESAFARYGAALYGFILNTSLDKKAAEAVMVQLFKTFADQKPTERRPGESVFLCLLRIAVRILSEEKKIPRETLVRLVVREKEPVC